MTKCQAEMAVRIINADVMEGLAQLADESVHCVVCSPPYWGLRDYGVEGQIGLEATPDLFVARMVEVFREVRRVLRPDGTLWLNLGDSYVTSPPGNKAPSASDVDGQYARKMKRQLGQGEDMAAIYAKARIPGLKQKDLVGVPWRVALALQADGWWLRSDIIWNKPNPMPESVTDRCTKAHEYIFMLTKSERYYYDAEAIKEAYAGEPRKPGGFAPEKAVGPQSRNGHSQWERKRTKPGKNETDHRGKAGFNECWDAAEADGSAPLTRNKRSVWTIATAPFSEAHFATFPPELPEICIKAGCPVGGTVLDPFGGAGTTGLVADRLQRHAILIELNPEYAAMAEKRIGNDRGGLLDVMEAAQ
jgi:DNA modification methylase